MTHGFGENMLDTIEKLLCKKLELDSETFKRNKLGEYTAVKDQFTLQKYVGAFWKGLQITHEQKEYLELDVTYDRDEKAPSDSDECLLEVKVAAAKINSFRRAVDHSKVQGALYDRLTEGCQGRIKPADDPTYSTLTVVIQPGEEAQAVKLIYSILTYKIKSDQTPAQPKKKLSRAEKFALRFAGDPEFSSED